MNGKSIISYLKFSSRHVGRLYPVLLDRHGNVIDGMHRLTADENWPKIRLENVETEEQRLIARLISNVCRRHVPAKEKTEMLKRLGEILLNEGVKPGNIAQKIAEETGMTCRWVTKYLPDKFKDSVQSKRASSAERRSAGRNCNCDVISIELEEPPKDAVAIKAYGNTDFVNIMVKKPIYEQLEEKAKKLETTPDKLIYNAILLLLKSIRA